MGKIKKILENELTGGNQSTEVYPVTSIKAVYDENNERLDNIIDRKDNEIKEELEAEVIRATDAESNLRETINNITEVNENATSANIVTIDTIPNTSSSNVQQALNTLFKNSSYAGIAIPTTNPGTPDGPVFYIATEAGTYSNFNGISVADGEAAILEWKNGWVKKITGFATQPQVAGLEKKTDVIIITKGSDNLLDINGEFEIGVPNTIDGTIDSSQNTWKTSDFIEIPNPEKGNYFCTRNAGNVAFYDIDKNWLYTQQNTRYSTTRRITVDGVVFARVAISKTSTTDFFYVSDIYWETQPTYSPYYVPTTIIKNLKIAELDNYATKDELDNSVTNLENTIDNIGVNVIPASPNMFDKSLAVIGLISTTDGILDESKTSYGSSEFIPVQGKYDWYYCSYSSYCSIAFYDENKEFVYGQENIPYSTKRKITNQNVAYARISFALGQIDNVFLYISQTYWEIQPEFVEYYKRKVTIDGLETKGLDIKDGNILLGEQKDFTGVDKDHRLISIGKDACKDEISNAIAIGTNALKNSTAEGDTDNGHYNVAIGHNCMAKNTTGNHNTAVGWGTMADNISGSGNTAFGEDALCHVKDGNNNTCIGNRAYQTGNGSNNTVIGQAAMYGTSEQIPTGGYNVAVGWKSGPKSGNGDNNTCIGSGATCSEGLRYTIVIGANATATKSRQVVIGSTNSGTPHPLETILNGDIIICGTDYVYRKLIFNSDGTIGWVDVSSDYQS